MPKFKDVIEQAMAQPAPGQTMPTVAPGAAPATALGKEARDARESGNRALATLLQQKQNMLGSLTKIQTDLKKLDTQIAQLKSNPPATVRRAATAPPGTPGAVETPKY